MGSVLVSHYYVVSRDRAGAILGDVVGIAETTAKASIVVCELLFLFWRQSAKSWAV